MENGNQPTQPTEAPVFTPGIQNAQPTPAPEPAQPAEQPQAQPTEQPQATPTEQPQAQPTAQPTEQPQAQPAQQQPQQPTVNYDEYLDNLIKQAGGSAPIETPKPPTQEQLDNDDQALTKFFGELVDTAVRKSQAESVKATTIREAETRAWNDVFTKYPEVQESKGLRDTIHNIRIGAYQRGEALSPIQVADQLIGELHQQYKKGVNDTNVQTTIRESQPMGGGTQTPAPQGVDYSKLHDGGQGAAIAELTKLIEQNKI